MCVSIEVNGKTAEDMSELIELVGSANVVNQDGSPPEENDEFCLCGVDVMATAEKAGYLAVRDPAGFGYQFLPITRQ